MKYNYTPVAQNQKDNPFWKLSTREQLSLHKELQDRLTWLCQLGASKDTKDRQFYDALVNQTDRGLFGSAPHYGNQPNTGMAALAGAVDKLTRGDLSQKQFRNIQTVLDACHAHYPHKWCSIEFEEKNTVSVETPLSKLFEIVDGT